MAHFSKLSIKLKKENVDEKITQEVNVEGTFAVICALKCNLVSSLIGYPRKKRSFKDVFFSLLSKVFIWGCNIPPEIFITLLGVLSH